MSRALPLTQRQAQTLLRAAEAEKGIIEVKVGDKVFRIIPASLAQKERPIDDEEDFRL
jgi:hypothetical protein